MMKKQLNHLTTVLILILICTSTATADVSVGVSVVNIRPNITQIEAENPVRLIYNGKTDVWCNATITDLNGYMDLRQVKAVLWNTETSTYDAQNNKINHYTSVFGDPKIINITTKKVSHVFSVDSDAKGGVWTCTISAVDSNGSKDTQSINVTAYPASCLNYMFDEGEVLTDCGGNCPPCITASPLTLEVPASKKAEDYVVLTSQSSEPIKITKTTETDLKSSSGTIKSEHIKVDKDFVLDPQSTFKAKVNIDVKRNTKDDTYNGTITFNTNTSINAISNVSVKVLPAPPIEIVMNVSKNCVGKQTTLELTDGETGKPLEGAQIRVYYRSKLEDTLTSDDKGAAAFTPMNEGTYVLNATKEYYSPSEKTISIFMCKLPETCYNEVKDADEEDIDCGGECLPCHCFNGIEDEGERGIDCGGGCSPCPTIPLSSQLVVIVPNEIERGGNLTIQVMDTFGNQIKAIISIKKPDETKTVKLTNDAGEVTVNADTSGTWIIKALKPGYMPTEKTVVVRTVTILAQVTRIVSYLTYPSRYWIFLGLVILLTIYWKVRNRISI